MSKITVAIIFGGRSSEHEVSRTSATMVIDNIDREKYDVVLLGITKSGEWFLYEGDTALIKTGEWEKTDKLTKAFISPDVTVHGIVALRDGGAETIRVDVAWPVLHGRNGEDGTMQGLFTLAGIPFVGCGCASSAVCMDKILTNIVLEQNGIPQAKFVWFTATNWAKDTDKYIAEVESVCGYPCFVKPANAGSSVGVSKCTNRDELREAVAKAAVHDERLLVEEGIDGMEAETAVIGNETPHASVVGEIVPATEWYDYDAKYNNDASELHIPARLAPEVIEKIQRRAEKAYSALGCEGLARVDFLVRRSDNEPLLNEPNTLPGFTPISMYPKLMEFDGISNTQLIDKLIGLALDRAEKQK